MITDIYLDLSDGLELIAELRRRRLEFPIIAMSGGMDKYDVLKYARKLGASASISKPFDPGELITIIKRLL